MSATMSRMLIRQSRTVIRRPAIRHSSTAQETAAKAKDAASSATSKASEGLTKVTAAAGPALAGAMSGVGGALKKVGGRTAKLVAFVESLIPPTIYYSRVGLELSKIVFRGQKMAPPDMATFQSYLYSALNSLRQPSTIFASLRNPNGSVSRLRNFDAKQWAIVGITTAEVIGFFSVGEMLGRFKVVGYRGEVAHEH
ncbi:ATP synthase subunit g [Trichophyton mentagrophytes]|uniref:Mitochondrial F1F0-ATP synthase g subunit n=4 Tax=Trichophyton TaxID=5550 RepID=D4B0W7_ARTBC|nr:uncharacterized protein ARB_02095 [Trichophyton benhamiae CBS 112371]EGD95778.1 mitochondrial F1F0-ATP synthase g subunit [Trichophyton tonsurans CBS 112818]EGE08936.1 hypothetical protein TEQG_07891 [Trichophyton equinum CBS 127.97]EZF32098.1 hypothetical protein H101_04311 [Trichophyton interdigitale H6]KAF3897174.1 F-type H+-transporting ATPase subunit G [Trichophyton interdigitale]KDB20425.1 hypothetical protein H109_07621 [Trichophyton interdigitale MR816]GBF59514.1 ATP synthase subun